MKSLELSKYLDGKKGVRLNKLVEDPEFDRIIRHEIDAYNHRIAYTGANTPRLKYRDFKSSVKEMSMKQFKSKWVSNFEKHYVNRNRNIKVSKSDVDRVKEFKPSTKLVIPKVFNEKLKSDYGKGLYEFNKPMLLKFQNKIQEYNYYVADKKLGLGKLKKYNEFAKLMNSDNVFGEIESEIQRLDSFIKGEGQLENVNGKVIWKSDIGLYQKKEELLNKKKEKELKYMIQHFMEHYKYEDIDKLNKMNYDEMLEYYEKNIEPMALTGKTLYMPTEYFKKKETGEDKIKEILARDKQSGKAIFRLSKQVDDLRTNSYIANFFYGLQNDPVDAVSDEDQNTILEILSKIPKEFISDIMLDDDLRMDMWYRAEENSFNDGTTKGDYLIAKIKQSIRTQMGGWYLTPDEEEELRKVL